MFAPSLKLKAIIVQKFCVIKKFFLEMHEVGPFLKFAHMCFLQMCVGLVGFMNSFDMALMCAI